jgi:GTPase Era involved in 16S rRNA processing
MSDSTYDSIMDRIIIDFKEADEDIHAILDEFLQFRIDKRIRTSVGADCIKKLQTWEINIKRRLEDDFSIVIIGDFKRGKSTLANALLREQIVTTNVTPETVTINRVSFGEKNSAEAVLKDGRRAVLNLDELKREKLDSILLKLPSPVEYIDIKAPIDTLKGIRIIDTPGVGDLLNRFDNQIKDYMIYADAVIYVVSALSPLSETEQTFLCASILPQNFSKLFVVVNMIDCLENKTEVDKVKTLINNKLTNIFPNSYVYAISGLDEYCRRKNLKRPNPDLSETLEQSFDDMYSTLQNDVIMKKGIIQTERCLSLIKQMISEIEARVILIDNMLLLNQSKLNDLMCQYQNGNSDLLKRIDKHKQTVKLDINEMYSEAQEWMEEFLCRLENEIRSVESMPLEMLEKHFHFYMIDMVRSAIIECTNTHLKSISELLKNTSEAFANEFTSFALSSSSTKIASSIVDISWTNLDAAAVALNFIPGLGTLTLLGQAVIGFAKQKNTADQQKKYISNVLGNYQQIKDSVICELRNIYENITQFAEQQLDRIYENQVAASLEAIKQAQEISHKEDVEKEDIKLGLESAKEIIESARQKLSKFEKAV